MNLISCICRAICPNKLPERHTAAAVQSDIVNSDPFESRWSFPLTKDSLSIWDNKSPLSEVIKSIFPNEFVPHHKSKWVLFRFENEDGSFWGGEDIGLRAKFEEFFRWKWADQHGGLHPVCLYRPVWLTFRAWQMLRDHVARSKWEHVDWKSLPSDEAAIEILKSRKQYCDVGIFEEHGFPARLVITLGDS